MAVVLDGPFQHLLPVGTVDLCSKQVLEGGTHLLLPLALKTQYFMLPLTEALARVGQEQPWDFPYSQVSQGQWHQWAGSPF